jgi:hypothetical protein
LSCTFPDQYVSEVLYVPEVGFDIGIGPYSPFQTFSDGQGLQMYDFIKREVYEEHFEEWTVNRPYPNNYFFNDHPNAGVRSLDYIYSVMGVISLGIMSCMSPFAVIIQFKLLYVDETPPRVAGKS